MKIFYVFIIVFTFTTSSFAQNVVYVNNAGSYSVNGSYQITADFDVPFYNKTPYKLYRYNNSHWVIGTMSGQAPSGPNVYYWVLSASTTPLGLTFTNVGALGTATLPSVGNSPLPVELTTFTANIDHDRIQLEWVTATEVNNYGFEVERHTSTSLSMTDSFIPSGDEEWEKIAFVEGHGNSNSPKYYSFTDKSIEASGKYFYRLKQIDIDGRFEYSNEVDINVSAPINFELAQNYPNPFNPTTTIKFTIPTSSVISNERSDVRNLDDSKISSSGRNSNINVTLKVYDVLGNEVAVLENGNKSSGTYSYNFDASHLTSGIYFYTIRAIDASTLRQAHYNASSAQGFVETKKMLLIK